MNRRTLFISAFSAAFLPDIARAGAPLTFVPQPGLVGSGRLNILTVPVLDVSLFAPLSHWRPDRPYALQVTFLRDLEARRMVTSGMRCDTPAPEMPGVWNSGGGNWKRSCPTCGAETC